MQALIKTIVCYLCAIICACSLAFAKNTDKFVATGPNVIQSLDLKFVYSDKGTFFVQTDTDVQFAAFNPEQLPEDATQLFFKVEKGVYSTLLLGLNGYRLNDLVFIDLGKTQVKISKSLLVFRLEDGSLAIMTNGKFIANVVNKDLAALFFNPEDVKRYGMYQIEGEELSFQGQKISPDSELGVGTKSYEVFTTCADKIFILENDVAKIKDGDPRNAKKTVEEVMREQQNLMFTLEAVLWIAPYVGLDTARMSLLEVMVKEKQCTIKRTALN